MFPCLSKTFPHDGCSILSVLLDRDAGLLVAKLVLLVHLPVVLVMLPVPLVMLLLRDHNVLLRFLFHSAELCAVA